LLRKRPGNRKWIWPTMFSRYFHVTMLPKYSRKGTAVNRTPMTNIVINVSTVSAGIIRSNLRHIKTGTVDRSRLPAIKNPLREKNDGTRNRSGSLHTVSNTVRDHAGS
jgi:hypothetical protein